MRVLDLGVYPYQHSIVDDLFIKTADENYVTARWCAAYGLNNDFFWLAVHALEKYCKATLLLNERPANSYKEDGRKKRYGHDIVRLYADVNALAPELMPKTLAKPKEIDDEHWRNEITEKYIERLYRYGQADNRYQLVGYVHHNGDLFKLDQVVFAVRRLCRPLETHFLGSKFTGKAPNITNREWLTENDSSSANIYSRLEDVMNGKRGKLLRHALLNCNFPFAPKDFRHTRMRYPFVEFVNSVLIRRILDPLDSGKSRDEELADRLWEWVRENVYLPKDFEKVYNDARTERKAKAKNRTLRGLRNVTHKQES